MSAIKAVAALLLLAGAAGAAEMSEDQFRWLLAQPANKTILSSALSREEKIARLSEIPANIEKFGPNFADDFRQTIVRISGKQDPQAEVPAEAARGAGASSDSDQHAVMGAGTAPAKRKTGGTRSGKAARASTKNSAAAPTRKTKHSVAEDSDQEEAHAKAAAAPAISADQAPSLGGAGIGTNVAPLKPLTAGRSVASSGSSGGGGGAPAAATAPAPGSGSGSGSGTTNPNQVLTVVCGATKNVLTWKLLSGRNSNSIIRNVDGGDGEYVCGGPQGLGSCSSLNASTFEDTDVRPGKTYAYRQKSAPACTSNTVTCPGGASSGESCMLGGVDGGAGGSGGSGGSGGGTGGSGPVDTSCTGGNPKCICVKDLGRYGKYRGVAEEATRAAFPNQDRKPAGMSDQAATQKICEAYNGNRTLGAGSACRPQGDEVVFQDPSPPDGAYPTTSVDVVTSGGAFWAKPIAACELGVQ